MNWSFLGAAITLALTGTFAVTAYRSYRRLKAWYDDDAARLWLSRPRELVLPLAGLGAAVLIVGWGGAYIGVTPVWAACVGSGVVSIGSRMLILLPHKGAQRTVMRDPMKYPLPQTPRHEQGRVAALILGGMALFFGLLIAGLVISSAAFPDQP